MPVGDNIHFLRTAFGMSQQDLADRIGVARSTVSQWEGHYGSPRMGNLQALAFVFRVSPTILAGDWSPQALESIAERALTGEVISEPPQDLPPILEVSTLELDRAPDAPAKGPRRQTHIYTYLLEDHPAARSVTLNAEDIDTATLGDIDVFYDPLAQLHEGDLALVENADHRLRPRKLQLEDLSNAVAVVRKNEDGSFEPDPRKAVLRILGLIFWSQCSQPTFSQRRPRRL